MHIDLAEIPNCGVDNNDINYHITLSRVKQDIIIITGMFNIIVVTLQIVER